jgi:outer membrane protein TolC
MTKTVLLVGLERSQLSFFLAFAYGILGWNHLSVAQTLSLQAAIAKAMENSPLAKQVRYQFQVQDWQFKANQASLLPQLSLNAQVPGFTRTINQIQQPDGSILFRPQSQNFSSATMSLSQNLLHTGGTLSLNSGLSRIDLFETDQKGQNYFWRSAPLFLQYSQPLFRINAIKWNWQQQKIGFDVAGGRQKEELEDLAIAITEKYFELALAKTQLVNAESNLHNNDTIYRISKGRFGIGKIAENELLQVELGLMKAKNEVERQQVRIKMAEKELRNLMGMDQSFEPLQVVLPHAFPVAEIVPEKAIEEAKANRSAYKSLELDENQARMNLRSAQISRRFSADLNLSIGYNQTAQNFNDAFQNLESSQSAFIGLSVPLHNSGRNRAQVKQAEAELNSTLEGIKNRKNEIEISVLNQVMQLKQLQFSLEISAKSDTIAQRRYQMAKNRYLIGKIDITNLTIAQQEKDDALINYIFTLQQYWTAWYQLRRATLFDFEKGIKL